MKETIITEADGPYSLPDIDIDTQLVSKCEIRAISNDEGEQRLIVEYRTGDGDLVGVQMLRYEQAVRFIAHLMTVAQVVGHPDMPDLEGVVHVAADAYQHAAGFLQRSQNDRLERMLRDAWEEAANEAKENNE